MTGIFFNYCFTCFLFKESKFLCILILSGLISPLSFRRVIYDCLDPQIAQLPDKWSEKINSFQSLCVLRTLRADKVPDGVLNYVIQKLGSQFVEPPPFDLMACYKDSNVLSPLVFVLSKVPPVFLANLLSLYVTKSDVSLFLRVLIQLSLSMNSQLR